MVSFFDQKIDSVARMMTRSVLDPMDQTPLSSHREGKEFLVLYNKKGFLQNVATVGAIVSVALALFSVISAPMAMVTLGGFLWARHCVSKNIDHMVDKMIASEGSLPSTLKDKIEKLVFDIESALPSKWKPQNSKIFGVPLFRSEIPWDVILPKTVKDKEKETSYNQETV